MPISANGGPAVSGADGESSGSLSVGNINMGGGGNSTTLMILVVIVIAAVLLWKKK